MTPTEPSTPEFDVNWDGPTTAAIVAAAIRDPAFLELQAERAAQEIERREMPRPSFLRRLLGRGPY